MADEPEPFVYRAAEWVEHNWIEIALGANPFIVGLVSSAFNDDVASKVVSQANTKTLQLVAAIVLFVLCLFQVWLIVANRKRKERLSKLRAEIVRLTPLAQRRDLQVKSLIFAYLKEFGDRDLGFGSKPHESERLTLYLHNDQRSTFVPISRYSNSPAFNEIARGEHPDHEGCLATAWRRGWYFSFNYPNPTTQWDSYVSRMKQDGMPQVIIEKLRMHPVLYCGAVIWNLDRTRPVGVLLLEATYDRYNVNDMDRYMRKHEHGYLSVLIDALDDPMPLPPPPITP